MAIPPTAFSFSDALDPQEELDFEIPCSPILETDETIASYKHSLWLPEAVALGLGDHERIGPRPSADIRQHRHRVLAPDRRRVRGRCCVRGYRHQPSPPN